MKVTAVLEGKIVLFIASAKIRSARAASHHPAFTGNCPNISHIFLALYTQLVSSLSGEKKHGLSPKFHLIVLCLL